MIIRVLNDDELKSIQTGVCCFCNDIWVMYWFDR